MIVAKQKQGENIVEYILYMFQIEDAIRANGFDRNLIKKNLVNKYQQAPEQLKEIEKWYNELVAMMIEEGIHKAGHMKLLKNIIDQLNDIHLSLINEQNEKYLELYSWALPNIGQMREKSRKDLNDIEVCINGLYMTILMRVQKKEVSEETMEAISTFSNMLAYLAYVFKKR